MDVAQVPGVVLASVVSQNEFSHNAPLRRDVSLRPKNPLFEAEYTRWISTTEPPAPPPSPTAPPAMLALVTVARENESAMTHVETPMIPPTCPLLEVTEPVLKTLVSVEYP